MDELDKILEDRERKAKEKTTRAKAPKKATKAKKITKKEQQIIDLSNNTVLPDHYEVVWTKRQLEKMFDWLWEQDVIAIDTETMGIQWYKDDIVGFSVYAPHRGFYVPLTHIDEGKDEEEGEIGIDYVKCLDRELVKSYLKPLVEEGNKKWLLHNAKFDMHILRQWMDIELKPYFDTMIAQAILDETKSKALKDLAPIYLNVPADKYGSIFGKMTFDKVPIKMNAKTRTGCLSGYYAIKDTELTYKLAQFQARNLNKPRLAKLKELYFDIEIPFLEVVVRAEARGVQLDENYITNVVAVQLHEELETLRQRIWSYTGEINLNSPKQLSEALYHKLKLPKVNKDKPESTDKKTMNKLKNEHEVVPMLIDFRAKSKLTQAFADKLPKSVTNGRIHTSFNPVGTKTGRMSSNSPNLQQIPSRVGGLIRNAFISDRGRLLASIDFSQQELRVLAHVSQDEVLLDIYRTGKDVHSMTATSMWNMDVDKKIKGIKALLYDMENGKDKHNVADLIREKKEEINLLKKQKVEYEYFEYARGMTELFRDADGNVVEDKFFDKKYVTKLLEEGKINTDDPDTLRYDTDMGQKFEKKRKSAKVVNFGIVYGMSELALSETLEISEEEAKDYIVAYFDKYPGVKAWMADQRKKMLDVYYTETMLGRKRRVHEEIQSGKKWLMGSAFRQGINAVIQGSSADMVKIASLKLQPLLEELDAQIVMWVHDEIIFDVPEDIGMDNLQRIANIMCTALPLDCGLKSDIEVGAKWGQKLSEEELDALREEM